MKQLSLLHAFLPYNDSEINHIRHFIKMPFINKGIEFIDLHSIFRYNNAISAIPFIFRKQESPITNLSVILYLISKN